MLLAKTNQELSQARANLPGKVGLVMTMGALHQGHLSLVRLAQAHADHVVVSIFVNPTQFAPGEDFDKYPRTLEADLQKLQAEGVDLVYAPADEDVYPHPLRVGIDPGPAARILEGAVRPTHFAGVCQVVLKVINRVRPDVAVFGQKDAQQYAILSQMVQDLDVPVELVRGQIVREADGLAMSSRNRYLTEEQRQVALALSRSLEAGREQVRQPHPDAASVVEATWQHLNVPGVEVDYVAVTSADDFALVDGHGPAVDATPEASSAATAPVTSPATPPAASPTASPVDPSITFGAGGQYYLLVAAKVGSTRLIDNTVLDLGLDPNAR